MGARARGGRRAYRDWYAAWWGQAEARFIDREAGSWRHELDPSNQPASTVWEGKPDVYHAYQAALLPSLGPAASFAGGLAPTKMSPGPAGLGLRGAPHPLDVPSPVRTGHTKWAW